MSEASKIRANIPLCFLMFSANYRPFIFHDDQLHKESDIGKRCKGMISMCLEFEKNQKQDLRNPPIS